MGDSVDNPDLERERLRLESARLELDRQRIVLDNRFFNKNLGAILTALVSVAAVVVSVAQLQIAKAQATEERQQNAVQKSQELALAQLEQERRWNLDVVQFLFTHRDKLFSSQPNEIALTRDLLLVAFPEKISGPVLRRLEATAPVRQRQIWTTAIEQAQERAVGSLLGGRWLGQFVYVDTGVTYGMDLEFRGSVREPRVRMFNHGANTWTGSVDVEYHDGDIIFDLPPNRFFLQLVNGSLTGEVRQGLRRVANVGFAK